MKNIRTLALVVAAGVILGVLSSTSSLSLTPAQAKPSSTHVEKYMTSGKLAVAQWFSADGDIFTNGYINLVDIAKASDGSVESFVDVFIEEYKLVEHCDEVNGEEVCYYDYEDVLAFFGSAVLDKSDFKISNNLRSASLESVEVTGYDYISGAEMTITVDAAWTDGGANIKQRNSFSETTEDYKVFFKGLFTGRAADASIEISGDIKSSSGDNPDYSDAFIAKAKNMAIYKIYEEPI